MTALSSLSVSLVLLTGSTTDISQRSHFVAVDSFNSNLPTQTDVPQDYVTLFVFFVKFGNTLVNFGTVTGVCPDLAVSSDL